MKVKDIMAKDVVTVKPSMKISDVARLLTTHRIHGVPVVNKKNVPMGIITMSDFFIRNYENVSLHLPSYIDFLKKSKFHSNASPGQKKSSAKIIRSRAEDIMSKDCVTIQADMDGDDLLERYRTSCLKTIPVVDNTGKLVGIVTRSDIIKLIKI